MYFDKYNYFYVIQIQVLFKVLSNTKEYYNISRCCAVQGNTHNIYL